MEAYPWLEWRPLLSKAVLIRSSTDGVSPGGFNTVGHGGIDYESAYYNGPAWWWLDTNASFSTYATNDGGAASKLDIYVNLDISYTRAYVTIAWMNSGTWTYDHRTATNPSGTDYDLVVYHPNGTFLASSASTKDGFETVNFNPGLTGTYHIAITRAANRDTGAPFNLGLAVGWR